MALLKVNGVKKIIGDNVVLNSISFQQDRNEKVAIVGSNGTGKTTLLKIIAGLLSGDEGSIYLNGDRVRAPHEVLVPGHKQIAYLSQYYHLQKNLMVDQILNYSNQLEDESMEYVIDICKVNHLLRRKTDQLSGGEKQRIALAQLLLTSPQLLVLDEPYTNLDIYFANTLKKVIETISDDLDITCLMVSHDYPEVLSWADTIIVLNDGRIEQMDTPEDIYRRPSNEYVAGLFGQYNILDRNGANVIVRPEELKVVKNGDIVGKVIQIKFYGSHYEIQLLYRGMNLYFHSEKPYELGSMLTLEYIHKPDQQ